VTPEERIAILREGRESAESANVKIEIYGLSLEDAILVGGVLEPEHAPVRCDDPTICRDFETAKDAAIFVCGGPLKTPLTLRQMATALAVDTGGVTFDQLCAQARIVLPDFHPRRADALSAWMSATAAYAQGASGRIRVLVGRWPQPASLFVSQSYSLLRSNANVSEIIAIDAGSGAERTVVVAR
jgi:hypothetical protein